MIFQRRPNTTAAPSASSSEVATRRPDNDRSNSEPALSSDPVLDFGISVETCDDWRRSIDTETKELASAINNSRDETAKENRMARQLETDLAHADAEMKSTKLKATDLVQITDFQEHLLQPLAGRLLTEITAPVSSISHSTGEDQCEQVENGDASMAGTDKIVKFSAALAEQKQLLKKRAEVVEDRKEALERLRNKKFAVEQKQQLLLHQTEGMEEEVAKLQKTAQESQAALEAEQQGNAKLQEALNQAQSSAAQWTEQCENTIKEWSCEKENIEKQEQDLRRQETETTKECDDLIRTLSLHEADHARLNEEIEELTRQLAECELLHKKKEEIQLEQAKVAQETSDLQKKEEEAMVQLAAVTARREEANEHLLELTNAETVLETEKLATNKLYSDKVMPGEAEMAELTKEKEQLVNLVDEMQEKIAAHKKTVDEALANIKESQEATEENLKTVQAEIESMRQMHCEVQQEHEKSNLAILSELEEVETQAKQTEVENDAEQKRIDEVRAERAAVREARLREANEAFDREHNDLVQARDVFIYGKEKLKKTAREKERILATRA